MSWSRPSAPFMRRGVGLIWIEHVVHALLAVVQRLVVLNFGKVVAPRAIRRW